MPSGRRPSAADRMGDPRVTDKVESVETTVEPAARSANQSGAAIKRNVLVTYANLLRSIVLGLLVTPVLFRTLGEAEFGTWSILLGAMGYVGLVEGGLSTALVARVAAAEARDAKAEIADLLRSGRALLLVSAGVGGLAVIGIAMTLGQVFDVPSDLEASAQVAMVLLGASALVAIVETSWTAALVGIGRVDVTATIGLVLTTVLAVAHMLLALAGLDIVALAGASLMVAAASLVLNRRAMHLTLEELPRGRARWGQARALASLGGHNLLVSLSGTVAFGSDVLIVGAVAGPRAAAAYSLAARASAFARSLAMSASDVLAPSFGNAIALGDKARLKLLYRSATFLGLFISVPIALAVAAVAAPLLDLWIGGESPPGSTGALIALCAVTAAQIPGHVAFVCFMGGGRSRQLLRFTLPSAALNLAASVALTYQVGVAGPALGSLFAIALVDPYLMRRLSRDFLDVRARDLYLELVHLLAVPIVVTLPVVGLIAYYSQGWNAAWAPLCAIAVGLAFVAASIAWLRLSRQGESVSSTLRHVPVLGARLAALVTRP